MDFRELALIKAWGESGNFFGKFLKGWMWTFIKSYKRPEIIGGGKHVDNWSLGR
jgi:hypothetical protein